MFKNNFFLPYIELIPSDIFATIFISFFLLV